jgi:hypothetical protein
MATWPKTNVSDLTFEQIEMIANFSDYSADYPALSFAEVAEKLGVDFNKSR